MKIFLTIGDISTIGGAERVCVNLANAFDELGFEVSVLSFFRANTILPYTLNEHIKLYFWHNISESQYKEKQSRHFLTKLYFKNLYKFFLSFRVFQRFSDFDVFIANCYTYIPFIKHKNTHYIRLIHENLERYNTRNNFFHTLVVLSHKELFLWKHYHKEVRVIPNFLPSIPPPHLTADIKQHRVLSVGRLVGEKGFLRLIDIWKKVQDSIGTTHIHLQNWQLVIVGGGELKEIIEAKIKKCDLQDSIILRPFTKDIQSEYLSGSIYAMASHSESFGMVLVEASSYALPCIAFDVKTGPSDIIESGKSGYLIEDNDLESFAQKLIELMDDESKRKTMGDFARQRVSQYYNKETILLLWKDLL